MDNKATHKRHSMANSKDTNRHRNTASSKAMRQLLREASSKRMANGVNLNPSSMRRLRPLTLAASRTSSTPSSIGIQTPRLTLRWAKETLSNLNPEP